MRHDSVKNSIISNKKNIKNINGKNSKNTKNSKNNNQDSDLHQSENIPNSCKQDRCSDNELEERIDHENYNIIDKGIETRINKEGTSENETRIVIEIDKDFITGIDSGKANEIGIVSSIENDKEFIARVKNKIVNASDNEFQNEKKNKDKSNYIYIDYEEDCKCARPYSLKGLIYEENTVYEIDEECLMCLKNRKDKK